MQREIDPTASLLSRLRSSSRNKLRIIEILVERESNVNHVIDL